VDYTRFPRVDEELLYEDAPRAYAEATKGVTEQEEHDVGSGVGDNLWTVHQFCGSRDRPVLGAASRTAALLRATRAEETRHGFLPRRASRHDS